MRTLYLFFSLFFSLVLLAQCTNKSNNGQPAAAEQQLVKDLTAAEEQAYVQKGRAITAAAFATLSSKLSSALEAGGVAKAVEVCNLAAMPLLDSLSKVHGATIRRVSDRPRNPSNRPAGWEVEAYDAFLKAMTVVPEPTPRAKLLEDGSVAYAAPIKLMPLCTKCHGELGTDVSEADYKLIRERYPDDAATGYKLGDLRGMWSVQFKR